MVRRVGWKGRPRGNELAPPCDFEFGLALRQWCLVSFLCLTLQSSCFSADTDAMTPGLQSVTLIARPALQPAMAPSFRADSADGADGVALRPLLDGRAIGCQSAQNWSPAQMLRMRARTLVKIYCEEDDCARAAAHSLAAFLNLQAAHQDDIGAATGLRAYYTRIAIAEQLNLADESIEFVTDEYAKQNALMSHGLAVVADLSEFERRQIEINDQKIQLHAQDRQLQNLLAQLCKQDYASGEVHQERLDIFPSSPNCDALKSLAMAQRQDLRSWRLLASRINAESAPEFAKMLPTLVGGWTLPMPSLVGIKQLICKPDYSCLAANMKAELDVMVEMQSDWIGQSVLEKCSQLELSYERIELAKRTIASWNQRVEQLEKLQENGQGKPDQSALAKSEMLKARSQEITRRLEARLAEIDLAEAIGGLAQSCCNGRAWLPR